MDTTRIAIDIAAHSRMLEPILSRFGDYLRSVPLSAPRIPVISNTTGLPLTDAQATSPDYWVAHLRGTVMFAQGMAHLTATPGRVYGNGAGARHVVACAGKWRGGGAGDPRPAPPRAGHGR